MTAATGTGATDGRIQRGERTRDAIADALLSLLEAGNPQPTAREIAVEAGVSLRSVFQHFADLEALYAMCVERQQQRLSPLRVPIEPDGPPGARAAAFVAQRARIYERIAPVRRASLLAAPSSPVLQHALAAMAAEHRRELAALFHGELVRGARIERLAAAEVATCFDTWDHLRRVQGLSVPRAQAVVRRLLTGALA